MIISICLQLFAILLVLLSIDKHVKSDWSAEFRKRFNANAFTLISAGGWALIVLSFTFAFYFVGPISIAIVSWLSALTFSIISVSLLHIKY